jgi:hypothetical protein
VKAPGAPELIEFDSQLGQHGSMLPIASWSRLRAREAQRAADAVLQKAYTPEESFEVPNSYYCSRAVEGQMRVP